MSDTFREATFNFSIPFEQLFSREIRLTSKQILQ